LTQLEGGDRLAGLGHHGLLAVDHRQVLDHVLEQRGLLGGGAHAHVDHDLLEARDLHDVGQLQVGLELGAHLGVVAFLETRGHRSVPHFLQTRTLRPWSSTRKPMRVAPHVEHTTATLETGSGMSLSMIPPCMVARVWRWFFLTRLTPSTMTFPWDGMARMTSPSLPRSLPDRTLTRSPFLILIAITTPRGRER